MPQQFDVVIVGARCAGSPLAAHLSKAGLRVCLVDRAAFPSDTLSTHFIEADGVCALGRLGVFEQLLAAEAAVIEGIEFRIDDLSHVGPWTHRATDPAPILCVRRTVLDDVLVKAAAEAGATVRLSTRVTGLVRDGGRVGGVEVVDGDGNTDEIRAALVVGADGAGSTVARLVGARRYHVVPNSRFCYWGYFEDAPWDDPSLCRYHFWEDEVLFATACDSGLFMANAFPPLSRLEEFRADAQSNYLAYLDACPAIGKQFQGARQVGPLRSIAAYPLFFRECVGDGWVLAGDAGHMSDPLIGRGISDALRQGERLVAVLVAGLDGSAPLDDGLAEWWRWRDDDLWEMHWFGADMGQPGPVPALLRAGFALLAESDDGMARYADVFNHRRAPSEVLTEALLVAAVERAGAVDPREGEAAAATLAQLADIAETRKKLRFHPVYG